MNKLKKALAVLLALSMLTGCSAKSLYSDLMPSSLKNNETSLEQDKQPEKINGADKKEEIKKESENFNKDQASKSQSSSANSSTKQSSSSKNINTPKKVVTQTPKANAPAAKPKVAANVEKVQLSASVQSQNNSTNNSQQSQQINIPGLPAINYEINNYDEYYKAIYTSLKNFESDVYIKINNYSDKVYNLNVIDSLMIDNYDVDYGLSYVKARIFTIGSTNILNIQFQYKFSKDKLFQMRDASQNKASQIIASIIKPGMTDLQKEKAIHDYIVTHTAYDYDNYLKGSLPGEVFNDYGVLINGKAVCEGYSKAMLKLMRMAGLEAKAVVGYGLDGSNKIPHAWNMVKINGAYTLVDATWDDPVPDEKNKVYYNYFNISDGDMAKDHQWDIDKYPKATAVK